MMLIHGTKSIIKFSRRNHRRTQTIVVIGSILSSHLADSTDSLTSLLPEIPLSIPSYHNTLNLAVLVVVAGCRPQHDEEDDQQYCSSELRVAGRRSLGVVAILMGRSMSWPPPIPCPIQCRAISLLGDGSWEGQMGARYVESLETEDYSVSCDTHPVSELRPAHRTACGSPSPSPTPPLLYHDVPAVVAQVRNALQL
eukprot:scaffold1963_cov89-Skeletonema_dohrnii-CCMP3373.AAC.2